ncbi:16S rRNA (guanine(966)-N(2))-methyltransferase RsmD [Fangia hongkongensis]|uniref:16S rRNA (guanine(966)-N(2))-methyltransferase RsmD n=1 Tax=Fangia hongkongensis TaxID=270495 RepID=UPI00037F0864|nr:16S rRNA (guanine(966)-N(2))-methyltransferase RsmD [Fangia hongkongensis]MBK2125085.1 16S rRNA (guanine(966)-N(2))-methyltransferase RsmD [Fangia hongkongensis]
MKKQVKNPNGYRTLRIIAGKFKARKCIFPNQIEGLRPTQDRVRETLFNWLMGSVIDAKCLDAFAGSGALGLEALSRGAKSCHFVEKNKHAIHTLKENCLRLNINNVKITQTDALSILASDVNYNLIFLDPPFAGNILEAALDIILKNQNVDSSTLIYIECAKESTPPILAQFTAYKSASTSNVFFALIHKN